METHSSTFAWKIPWIEEPGRLQSMGLHRVGHDWSDLAAAAAAVILLAWLIYFLRQDSNLSTNYKSRIESSRWNVSCEKIHWLSGRDEPNIYLCHSIQYFLSLMN